MILAPKALGSSLRRCLPAPVFSGLQALYTRYHRRVVARAHRRWLNLLTTDRPARVRSGPFQGMRYGDGVVPTEFVSKWLGTYEQELHASIERLCTRPCRRVINIGCAEGYYAVGLARQLPQTRGFAFDIEPSMRDACRRLAQANNVSDRLDCRGRCTQEDLQSLIEPGVTAVVCDCEGAELELLDPTRVPHLLQADVLVELHDFLDPRISQTIESRFRSSHAITRILSEKQRSPDHPELAPLPARERAAALDEYRPGIMQWFWMEWRLAPPPPK